MKLYLITSLAPKSEHIDLLVVSADSPEQAFWLWDGHYGYPWPCRVNSLPPISATPQIEPWSSPSYFPPGTEEPEDEEED